MALRFITAASLFDGHDVTINIIRRILQAEGVEVIHLGHNRSAEEVAIAALQEDVHGIAVSSYQGGHLEYFKYLVDLLKQNQASEIKIFGGGGGVILPAEIQELHAYGVERIYSPEDGRTLGLKGMVQDMINRARRPTTVAVPKDYNQLSTHHDYPLARWITAIEIGATVVPSFASSTYVLGVTGTGGAGKSSVVDELVRCFRTDNPELRIAVLALDPTKKKTGGALLGDRIRMNTIHAPGLYMRSMATRVTHQELTVSLGDVISACKAALFDFIIVETPGIGQGNSAIVPFVDTTLYVMTPEFGAPSQLEKIDMLDFATWVAINKFDRRGAQDALRDVRKQLQRNREAFDKSEETMPVYGTIAARFQDEGILALYFGIREDFQKKTNKPWHTRFSRPNTSYGETRCTLIPEHRQRYLAEVAETLRQYHVYVKNQATLAHALEALEITATLLKDPPPELDILKQQKEPD